jgi:hypothetical protein
VLTATIKSAVSEHEVAMMRIRQRRAAVQRAQRGLPKWKAAFGYLPDTRRKEDDDGTRQIDEKIKPLVEQAYAAVLSGSSLMDIARLFNGAGAVGLTGKAWTASTVSLFLTPERNYTNDYACDVVDTARGTGAVRPAVPVRRPAQTARRVGARSVQPLPRPQTPQARTRTGFCRSAIAGT